MLRRLRLARSTYRENLTYTEGSLADRTRIFFRIARRFWKLGRTILFIPARPVPMYRIAVVCRILGYKKSTDPSEPYHVAFKWMDQTFSEPTAELLEISKKTRIINLHCSDISKETVDKAMMDTFGYRCGVDPLTFNGAMLCKSNLNAQDDEYIVHGPIEKREQGRVYQRLINNIEGDISLDLRVNLCSGSVVACSTSRRPNDDRFTNDRATIAAIRPDKVLSPSEISQLEALGEELHLDFGDFDVLRDNDDGLIYVVDVNNTPTLSRTYGLAAKAGTMIPLALAFERDLMP